MSIFGKRLKELRDNLGLSQRAFARLLELDPTAINRYEKGERLPTEPVIRQVAEKLNVSADYLLGLTDNPQPWNNDLPEHVRKQLEEYERLKEKWEKLFDCIDKLK